MEIIYIILWSTLSQYASYLLVPILLVLMIRILLIKETIFAENANNHINKLLMQFPIKWLSGVKVEGRALSPALGIHFAWFYGPIMFIKSSEEGDRQSHKIIYKSYSLLQQSFEKIKSKIEGDGTVSIDYHEQSCAWRSIQESHREKLVGEPTEEQSRMVAKIIEGYTKKNMVSCLIAGKPNCGKSYLGRFLYKELSEMGYNNVSVVYGISLSTAGMIVCDFIDARSDPQIIILDEIDQTFAKTAIEHTEKEPECWSLAKDKTSLCNALDRLNHMKDLIIIATTNVPLKEICEKYPAFTRKGRFDLKETMTTVID